MDDGIGGLVGGVVGGWVFRDRSAKPDNESRLRARAARLAPAAVATAGPAASASAARPEQGKTGTFAGPRADLHRQLDDLGI